MSKLCSLFVLLLAVFIAGCAGPGIQARLSEATSDDQPIVSLGQSTGGEIHPGSNSLLGGPGFPVTDLPEPRASTVTSVRRLNGAEYWQASPATYVQDTRLLFYKQPTPVWAIYKFGGLDPADKPRVLSFELNAQGSPLPKRCYVGISDFAQRTWNWYSVNGPSANFALGFPPGDVPPPSPSGNLYVCMLCLDEPLALDKLALSLDYLAPPPVDLRASDGTSHQGIELTWTDPDVTYEGGPEFEYDGISIERATAQFGPWELLATVAPGITSHFDSTAREAGPVPLFYRLRLVHLKGMAAGHIGIPDQGYVNFLPQIAPIEGLNENFWILPSAPVSGTLSAVGSHDPDGGSLTYEWSYGEPDNWVSSGQVPIIQHTFLKTTVVWLRATDEEGTAVTANYTQKVSGFGKRLAAQYEPGGILYTLGPGAVDVNGHPIMLFNSGFCKLDNNFNVLWSRAWDKPISSVACAPNGFIYGVHSQAGIAHISRFTANGELDWSRQIDFPANTSLINEFIEATLNGQLWVVGQLHSYVDQTNRCVIMLVDASGDLLLSQEVQGLTYISSATSDSNGHLVAVTPESGAHVFKLSRTGEFQWQKRIEADGQSIADSAFVTAGNSTSTFICNVRFVSAANDRCLFSLADDGSLQWRFAYNGYWLNNRKPLFFADPFVYFETDRGLARYSSTSFQLTSWAGSSVWLFGVSGGQPICNLQPNGGNWSYDDIQREPVSLTLFDSNFMTAPVSLGFAQAELNEISAPEIVAGSADNDILVRFDTD